MRRNILITSAGRRGKLVAMFQQELHRLLPDGQVFAADHRPKLSVACHLADGAFSVPRVDHSDYAHNLLELCERNAIGLVVPTIDTELTALAEARDEFAANGTSVVVSDAEFVRVCRDKRLTADWMTARDIKTPAAVDAHRSPRFPIFAKPFDGSCSKGIRVLNSASELTPEVLNDNRLMFVEYLSRDHFDEFTVDMYFSHDGGLKCLVPRLRIETRGGEVSKGRTARIAAIAMLQDRLENIPGARGCITLQIFVERASGEVYAIEINPRFGGGYPLSYEAGANYPRWLIEEYLLGKTIESFDDWESDLTMLRYDAHVVVRGAAA